jgi:hypothetical protein
MYMTQFFHYVQLVVNLVAHDAAFQESLFVELLTCVDYAVSFGRELEHHSHGSGTQVADDIIFSASVPVHAVRVATCSGYMYGGVGGYFLPDSRRQSVRRCLFVS